MAVRNDRICWKDFFVVVVWIFLLTFKDTFSLEFHTVISTEDTQSIICHSTVIRLKPRNLKITGKMVQTRQWQKYNDLKEVYFLISFPEPQTLIRQLVWIPSFLREQQIMHEFSHSGNFQSFRCFQTMDDIHLLISLYPMPNFNQIFQNSNASQVADGGFISLINKKLQVPGFMTLRNSLIKLEGTLAHTHSISKRTAAFQKCMRQTTDLKKQHETSYLLFSKIVRHKSTGVRILLEGEVLMQPPEGKT